MAKVSASTVISKPVSEVWDYVSDWSKATSWIYGLKKYEPQGEQVRGVGSRVAMAIQLGPSTQESVIEYYEWVEGERHAYKSVSGFSNGTRLTLTAEGDGTRVALDSEFELGGGLAGKMLAKTIEPAAKLTASQTLKTLKETLEQA